MPKAVFSAGNSPSARISVLRRLKAVRPILFLLIAFCTTFSGVALALDFCIPGGDTTYYSPSQRGWRLQDLLDAVNGNATALAKFDSITAPVVEIDPLTGLPARACVPAGLPGPVDDTCGVNKRDRGGQNLINQIINALGGTAPTVWGGLIAGDPWANGDGAYPDGTVLPLQTLNPASINLPTNAAPAATLISQAIAGDNAALIQIQTALVGQTFFETLGAFGMHTVLPFTCGTPAPVTGACPDEPTSQNLLVSVLAFISSGTGDGALDTLRRALGGDAVARNVLTVIFSNPPVAAQTTPSGCIPGAPGCTTALVSWQACFTGQCGNDSSQGLYSTLGQSIQASSSILKNAAGQPACPGSNPPPGQLDVPQLNCVFTLALNGDVTAQFIISQTIFKYKNGLDIGDPPIHIPGAGESCEICSNKQPPCAFIGSPAVAFLDSAVSVLPPGNPPPGVEPPPPPPTPSQDQPPVGAPGGGTGNTGSGGGTTGLPLIPPGGMNNWPDEVHVNKDGDDPVHDPKVNPSTAFGAETPCDLSGETSEDVTPMQCDDDSSCDFRAKSDSGANPAKPSYDPCLMLDDNGDPVTDSNGKKVPSLTRNTRELDFAKNYQAGEQWAKWFPGWVTEQWIPALKNLTQQIHASIIDQTRQIGSTYDAVDIAKAAVMMQKQQAKRVVERAPSELACVAGSSVTGVSLAESTSNAMTKALKHDLKLAANTGSIPNTDFSSVTPPPPVVQGAPSAGAAISGAWNQYCKYFYNPVDNNGWTNCANAGTPGVLPNSDIDVEGFLLRETIDLTKPEQLAAAEAIARNLIQPRVRESLPAVVLQTAAGRERKLVEQHIESARAFANDTVTNILSRRMAIAYAVPPPKTPPSHAADILGTVPDVGPVGKTFKDFLYTLGMASSSGNYQQRTHSFQKQTDPGKGSEVYGNYLGAYAIGERDLAGATLGCVQPDSDLDNNDFGAGTAVAWSEQKDTGGGTWIAGNTVCAGVDSVAKFLNSKEAQNQAATAALETRWNAMITTEGLSNFLCKMVVVQEKTAGATGSQAGKKILVTPSGMLSMAWLVGPGGVKEFLTNGVSTGNDVLDGNGASGVARLTQHGGFAVPSTWASVPGDGTCAAEVAQAHQGLLPEQANKIPGPGDAPIPDPAGPPSKPVDQMIKEIRLKAGVDPAKLVDPYKPSYNEVMLALTKERFLSPDYYTRIGDEPGALEQELAAVNAYVTIQMKDIYDMRERINALLVARAALKFNAPGRMRGSLVEYAPINNP